MCRRSTGSPAFLVPHLREGIGKLVGAIPRVHAGTVAGPTGEGRAAGRHEARHDRRGRTLPSRDDARDEPPVLGTKSCSAAQLKAEMIGANRRISGGPVRSGRATKTVLTPRSASSR